MDVTTKVCCRCVTEKPLAEFPIDLRRPDGRYPYCLDCKRDYMRDYRSSDPERERLKNRASNIKRLGITPDEYDAMLDAQGGRCAICGTDKPGRGHGRMVIDHDHQTGRLRALLCGDCNNGLGHFGDDPVRLRAAAEYIERFTQTKEE